MMGAALEGNSWASFVGKILAEHDIRPMTSGSCNVATSMLEGEYGTVFCAIEGKETEATIAIPFASTDILTGRKYAEGEVVNMSKYECIFAKKD